MGGPPTYMGGSGGARVRPSSCVFSYCWDSTVMGMGALSPPYAVTFKCGLYLRGGTTFLRLDLAIKTTLPLMLKDPT